MLRRIKEVAEWISSADRIRVFTHHDCDGICAGSIAARALTRASIGIHLSIIKELTPQVIQSINGEQEPIMFLDMGSGEIEPLRKIGNVVIVDHHKPHRGTKKILHLNPHLFNIDGTWEVCGSSLAFLVARELDEKNKDLAALAIAGMVGDKQLPFKGLNKEIVARAVTDNVIKRGGLRFRNLNEVTQSIDPWFESCQHIGRELEEKRIPHDFSGLTKEQQKTLNSVLTLQLLRQHAPVERIEEMLRSVYLPQYGTNASSLATLLNACGRMGKLSLGIEICLSGDLSRGARAKKMYLTQIRTSLSGLKNKLKQLSYLQYFWEENRVKGVVAGIGMDYLLGKEKPVLALSKVNRKVNVSSRATKLLVNAGIDLASAMQTGADQVGGRGGGHPIAAGASIPKDKVHEFLAKVDKLLGEQLEK